MKNNCWTEEGKTDIRKKIDLGSETGKSIAHHPLYKLGAQGWIIKKTEFPRLESVWNLAILCDLYILCVTTDTEKR